jgi:AhpD family alkylhydroperoxidase
MMTTPWFAKRAPEMAAKWRAFHDSVYELGRLDRKTKELISVAAATFNRCLYCTRSHIQQAQEHGASKEEVAEALMMAGLLASGTQLHWMLEEYERLLG